MIDSTIHEFATAASRSSDDRSDKDDKVTVWAFVWTLVVFKIVTIGAIFWAAGGSGEAGILLAATSWFWLVIPIALLAGPTLYFIRIRRVRRRRAALQRAEWSVT